MCWSEKKNKKKKVAKGIGLTFYYRVRIGKKKDRLSELREIYKRKCVEDAIMN